MPMWNDKCSVGTRISCTGINIDVQCKLSVHVLIIINLCYPRKDMPYEPFSIAVAVRSNGIMVKLPCAGRALSGEPKVCCNTQQYNVTVYSPAMVLIQDGACIYLCWDFTFSVYTSEYVLWHWCCWTCLYRTRLDWFQVHVRYACIVLFIFSVPNAGVY